MTVYSISDAVRHLRPVLDKAPSNATSGEWITTTEQAGVSSQSGGYSDAQGRYLSLADITIGRAIQDVVGKLETTQVQPFNKVVIRWTKARMPFIRGHVSIETTFDEAIVPRGPHHPAYEAAAVARRVFWRMRGDMPADFAAGCDETNLHSQTKWFGPHRRILSISRATKLTLATDGLSTPWAGVPEPENGVGCELFMEFDPAVITSAQINDWAQLLLSVGDLVADGYRVANDVEKHGAILFCRLTDDYGPMTRIILSRDRRRIENLPFGSIPLIRVTAVAETEIAGQDCSDEWAVIAAQFALANRHIET